jgi:hypothetical protein
MGLEIKLLTGLKIISVGLLADEIVNIQLQNLDQTYGQEEKSTIGRAIVGGLLLGPVGAVVGGISGLGSKGVKSTMPDMVCSVNVGSINELHTLLFTFKFTNKKEVVDYFEKLYPNRVELLQ